MNILAYNLPQEYDTLELFPLSDLHYGDPNTDTEAFEHFCGMILDKPNRYIVSIGDNINNNTKSSVGSVYDDICSPRKQKKWIVERLNPLKDRILVMLDGNHEYRSTKDVDETISYNIANALGIEGVYAEDEAVLKITFGKKQENGKARCFTVYCTHGSGGGKRPGSTVNNIEMLALSIDADIYIIGHAHKRIAYKNSFRRIDTHNNSILTRERLFVVSSSWVDYGGYAARKMMNPSAKGSVPVILYAKNGYMEARV
jgi:predicted phosphodiesterase